MSYSHPHLHCGSGIAWYYKENKKEEVTNTSPASTTVNTYNTAYKEFKKMDKDVVKIADTGGKVEPMELEKPREE